MQPCRCCYVDSSRVTSKQIMHSQWRRTHRKHMLRAGPTCGTHILPACRTTDRPGVPVFVGLKVPKACECYRQLQRLSCLANHCDHHTMRAWASIHCFTRTGVSADVQTSALPGPGEAVQWFTGMVSADGTRSLVEAPAPPPVMATLRPLSHCTHRCAGQRRRAACWARGRRRSAG